MVETVNDRPVYKVSFYYNFWLFEFQILKKMYKTLEIWGQKVFEGGFVTIKFQRAEKTENGGDIYMWYYLENNGRKQWFITSGSDFLDRNDRSWLYINSEGEQEFLINTGGTLFCNIFWGIFVLPRHSFLQTLIRKTSTQNQTSTQIDPFFSQGLTF